MATVREEPVHCEKCGVLLFTRIGEQFQIFTRHHGYMTVRGPVSGECRRCEPHRAFMVDAPDTRRPAAS